MKIAWYSNSPVIKTGYGRQTALIVPELAKAGHEVTILATSSVNGARTEWNGFDMYPVRVLWPEADIIHTVIDQIKPDVIISFLDAWAVPASTFGEYPWCPWFPVDTTPVSDLTMRAIQRAMYAFPCSQFGQDQLAQIGCLALYAPCAIDAESCVIQDSKQAREMLGLPTDAYLCGMVADNNSYPSRKAFPEQLRAFAMFRDRHPDAHLYLHTTTSVKRGGIDIQSLCRHLKISDCVHVVDQEEYRRGLPDDYMAAVYSSLDMLLACSMGEGFGVPIIEAQAFGCPVVAGGWSAMPELVVHGSIVTQGIPAWNQQGGFMMTPNPDSILSSMEVVYQCGKASTEEKQGIAAAIKAEYDIRQVFGEYWTPLLEEITERLDERREVYG
jgi:glycosyltransferase involved in cell wall biosynthesis